jgi:hypothetical protein
MTLFQYAKPCDISYQLWALVGYGYCAGAGELVEVLEDLGLAEQVGDNNQYAEIHPQVAARVKAAVEAGRWPHPWHIWHDYE